MVNDSIIPKEDIGIRDKHWLVKNKIKSKLYGNAGDKGLLKKIVVYALLFSLSFIFVFPLLFMLSTSMMPLGDLIDSSVRWIPTQIYIQNFSDAIRSMDYLNNLGKSIFFAGALAVLQTVACSLTGYAFARYEFRGKKILMVILIITFVIPPQILMLPNFLMFFDMGLLGTMSAFTLPAMLGQGLQSAIMILIFYQIYAQLPTVLTEAAEIDGASQTKIFWYLGVRSAIPAFIIVFALSFVFYWNETHLTQLYLGNVGSNVVQTEWTTLQLELARIENSFMDTLDADAAGARINEGIIFAGTLLSIFPLFFLIGFLQKYLVESIDGAGITGE